MKIIVFILVLTSVLVTSGCILPVPTSEGGPYASREARQEALEERQEALEERREAIRAHQRQYQLRMHQNASREARQEALEARQEALEERREAIRANQSR